MEIQSEVKVELLGSWRTFRAAQMAQVQLKTFCFWSW